MPRTVLGKQGYCLQDVKSWDDWRTSSKRWHFETVRFCCPVCGVERIAKDVTIDCSFALIASFGDRANSAVLRKLAALAPNCDCDRNRFRIGCELQRRARMVRLKKP